MRGKICDGLIACAALAALAAVVSVMPGAQAQAPNPPPAAPQMPPSLVPALSVDLMTTEGSAAFGAQWKTMEAKIVERAPLAERLFRQKTAYDIAPHAGEAGFDDSSWPKIEAKDLADRRGGGKVSFFWFRTNLTIPANIGNFETAGAKAVLTA